MLRVRVPLLASAREIAALRPEIRPYASAEIAVRKNHGAVKIALEGVILDASARKLRHFLKDVSSFRATDWSLQLEALQVISTKGLRALVQFSHVLQARGSQLKIENIHKNVYLTLQDMNLLREFAWPD